MVSATGAQDGRRARLERDLPAGVPVLSEAAVLLGTYLGQRRPGG
jgi:hypothetical protein